jgi:hypothetical protein
MDRTVYEYIKTEETAWKTTRIPLTNSKDWNMSEHIERCFNVSNGWFHNGKNDGNRPYEDIVTPIIDVAFRLEGFDVKDIVPYVNDISQAYKSFFVKKFHPQWARKNQLDSFIDEVVETSIIYDLVLVKDVNSTRPEVVKLQDIAFCDQTDVMSGPICLKHNYSITDLLDYKGKWDSDKIDDCIVLSEAGKKVAMAKDQKAKTPGKYIEVYELHGSFPETWLKEDGDPNKYVEQLHIVSYYDCEDGTKGGITLYKGKSKKLSKVFKALKIDQVRSHGRACGRSVVERLFEPQVWRNYSGIKLKKMLDSAVNLLQTDSEEFGNKKISDLKDNTVLKHEPGRPITRIDMGIQNFTAVRDYGASKDLEARTLGSASEAALGRNPASGTPFALQDLIVQQGEGIHEYRRGKIATFFADVLYPELILEYLVRDINKGLEFSEELSVDELQEVANTITDNYAAKRVKELLLSGKEVTKEGLDLFKDTVKKSFLKGGNRKFIKTAKDEFADIPLTVFVNVAGKQRYMAQNADKLSKLISYVIANPQAFATIPGLSKSFNQLLEESGMSAIDFSQIVAGNEVANDKAQAIKSPLPPEQIKSEQLTQ